MNDSQFYVAMAYGMFLILGLLFEYYLLVYLLNNVSDG